MTPQRSLAFAANGGLGAASAARRAVLAGDGAVPTSAREDILLLVSELVSNAVRHAGVGQDRSLRVGLSRWPRRVRAEVAHPGNGFQHDPGRPSLDADGGWGLVLIDRIADAGDREPRGWRLRVLRASVGSVIAEAAGRANVEPVAHETLGAGVAA
jgi:two-component sensor histidine kinase